MFADINLSASPNVTADMTLTAHLKPTFEFGVTALGATSGIYLNLDASAELDLSLTGAASGSVSSSNSTSVDTGAGGCVDISTGLSVNAGGDLNLGFIQFGDSVPLFSKSFDLFKKCFGNNYQKRDYRDDRNRAIRRTPLSPFEQNLNRRKRHHGLVRPQAAVGRRRSMLARRDSDGFSCPTSLLGALSSIVSETVDSSR